MYYDDSLHVSRRHFLQGMGGGFGMAALAALIQTDSLQAGSPSEKPSPSKTHTPHHAATARAVIQIFCPGGMSH
ncbi:MAG: hypothetical protein KDA47_17490, partial [Planctomycetales bacterium]|nr:hypothetical protein [Planctomycetales bacterium]